MEKPTSVQHLENHSSEEKVYTDVPLDTIDNELHDEKRNRLLNRRLDLRILPLCCWVYLLNFLDRGNIGQSSFIFQRLC